MKKAKVMLASLAIVAVLGSAFAFKAKTFIAHFIYTGTSSTTCTHKVTGAQIGGTATAVYASTASITTGCEQNHTESVTD